MARRATILLMALATVLVACSDERQSSTPGDTVSDTSSSATAAAPQTGATTGFPIKTTVPLVFEQGYTAELDLELVVTGATMDYEYTNPGSARPAPTLSGSAALRNTTPHRTLFVQGTPTFVIRFLWPDDGSFDFGDKPSTCGLAYQGQNYCVIGQFGLVGDGTADTGLQLAAGGINTLDETGTVVPFHYLPTSTPPESVAQKVVDMLNSGAKPSFMFVSNYGGNPVNLEAACTYQGIVAAILDGNGQVVSSAATNASGFLCGQ
jgi:hypothetical protein